jgi:hypothetical protein
MEEKSERPDLRIEKRAGVMTSGRKCQRASLTHTGLLKGHHDHLDLPLCPKARCHVGVMRIVMNGCKMTMKTETRR